jgi:predicted outer membrane repeat protein
VGASVTGNDSGAASLTIGGSTISGNNATGAGGGLAVFAHTLPSPSFGFGGTAPPATAATATFTLTTSTVEGKSAGSGNGGGLWLQLAGDFNAQGTSAASVSASTFDGNSAGGQGGAVFAQETGSATSTAHLTITNSTLYANAASAGAGLYNSASGPAGTAGASLLSDTVAFNAVSSFAGGVVADGGPVAVRSSIIADNAAGAFPAVADVSGAFLSGGHNLIGQTDGSSGGVGSDLTGTSANPLDAMFADFGNHGGPTNTLALAPGSPAIGHGDPNGPKTDQRGVLRSRTAPSIGAFEFTG